MVKACNICQQHQHAKWHEYSDGKIINPIALLEMIESLPDCDAKNRMRSWVSFIAGIQWGPRLAAFFQEATQEPCAFEMSTIAARIRPSGR